jgi:hypothetical protein
MDPIASAPPPKRAKIAEAPGETAQTTNPNDKPFLVPEFDELVKETDEDEMLEWMNHPYVG